MFSEKILINKLFEKHQSTSNNSLNRSVDKKNYSLMIHFIWKFYEPYKAMLYYIR
jgi:hypothetical protein